MAETFGKVLRDWSKMTLQIQLTQSAVAFIDDENFERVNQYKWYATKMKDGKFYAQSWMKGQRIYLHNFIMQPPIGLEVDHIDRNGLNCTYENMRLATHSENCVNRGIRTGTTSQYRGVSFDKWHGKWRAQITINGNKRKIGLFNNEVEAAYAYDDAARKNSPLGHGEFAQLNFPNSRP